MESLDRQIDEALADNIAPTASIAGPARMLIVEADAALRQSLIEALERRHHHCTGVGSVSEARSALARTSFDVVVLNHQLVDKALLELMPLIQKTSPATKTVLIAERCTLDDAVRAMRCGVVDLIALPVEMEEFIRRIDTALLKSRADRQRDERLLRLKKICRELNVARHEISRQVDALCGDLTAAYQEIADQMNEVAMASEFRTLIKQELDVEDLLRTTLEYMLTKTGPTNAAVFLPDSAHSYGLGAYVNYDCPRETVSLMLDHLCQAVCPQMADEDEIVCYADAREFAEWIGIEADFLADSEVIAFSCQHEGECLAVIVLFRNKSNPFSEKLAGVIDTMRTLLAEQLSNIIRVHHRARPSWPKEAADGDLDYNDDINWGFEGGMAA